ncbi:MAG: hypothetical protein ACYCTH_10180 [Cellulomonas sp.]
MSLLRLTPVPLTPEVVAIEVDVDVAHFKDQIVHYQTLRSREPTLGRIECSA